MFSETRHPGPLRIQSPPYFFFRFKMFDHLSEVWLGNKAFVSPKCGVPSQAAFLFFGFRLANHLNPSASRINFNLLFQRNSISSSYWFPRPGPTIATLTFLSKHFFISDIEGSSCINSGGLSKLLLLVAQNSFPAPERRLEIPAIIPAPSIPSQPPKHKTEPLVPLWALFFNWGKWQFSLFIRVISASIFTFVTPSSSR